MSSQRLTLRCAPFTTEQLLNEIANASGGDADRPVDQARYLASYLSNSELSAKSVLVEAPYVDRHYLEEYARYYATTLRPPKPKATRLHFFSDVVDDDLLSRLLREAASGKHQESEQYLQTRYLGFVVVRPLPSCPIGRSVLRVYHRHGKRRCYGTPSRPADVHLAGMRLEVTGIPFQQQDQAVGACATTAIWCALARVMRGDGRRPPTPFSVTDAATRNFVSDRAFPAVAGLKMEQMMEAIRQFGYSPLYMDAVKEHAIFKLLVRCYVRSGIPVVLQVNTNEGGEPQGHAMAVVGFREEDDDEPAKDISCTMANRTVLRVCGMSRIYLHDDRLGPYARATWEEPTNGFLRVRYRPQAAGYEGFETDHEVNYAIAPLYPKIRLSAQDLAAYAAQLWPLMRYLVPENERYHLRVDLRFSLAGDFLRELLHSGIAADRAAEAARSLVLSRYVGVIEFRLEDDLLAYVLCDTTDIRRDAPPAAPLLAMIAQNEDYIPEFKKYAAADRPDAMVF